MTKTALLVLLIAGCGSRTGVLSPDPIERPGEPDGGIPMEDDGGADAGTDAGMNVVDPPPPEIEPAIQVAAGLFHSCAATRLGRVHCWGFNNLGQVGDGTTDTRREPVAHPGVHDAIAITSGREHSCAIRGDRSVSCWGANITRQLGDGTSEFRRLSPVQVVGVSNVVEIAAGGEHTCARTGGDRLYCWGRSFEPVAEPISLPEPVVEIAGGYRHTCARLASGRVSCWGNPNLPGRPHASDDPESFIREMPPAVAITAGDYHSCAIDGTGAVWCWAFESIGIDRYDEWGNPISEAEVRPTIAELTTIDDAVQLAAGHEFTCALRAGGRVTCWGNNERGQLGDGGANQAIGAFVDPVGLGDVIEVTAGWRHACALQSNGVIMCWGRNTEGQLGDGSTAENHLPIMAAVLND
jgi:alpha-tubulin suppressor-like RCC1 family protein